VIDAYEVAGGLHHFTRKHPRGGRQCAALGGVVERIEYDVAERIGTLHAVTTCNMHPVILMFMRIDPGVREIRTFAEGQLDTIYRLDLGGFWQAVVV